MQDSAAVLLALLLLGDAVFVALHLVNSLTPLVSNPLLNIEQDRGFAEVFQYLKFIWIIALLGTLYIKTGRLQYLPWALMFIYLLLDDSMSIHESLGGVLASWLSLTPMLGLRAQDYGELIVTAVAALLIFPALILVYWKGAHSFRQFSQDLGLLLLLLVFFGVGVDMLHVLGNELGHGIGFLLGTIEDGGEMLAVSLCVWYVFLTVLYGGTPRSRVWTIAWDTVTRGWTTFAQRDRRARIETLA